MNKQLLYRARKSAVVDAVEAAVAAGTVGDNGFTTFPFRTTSSQEGELDAVVELHCGASCCPCDGDPDTAGQAAPTTLPVSGGGGATRGQTGGGR